MRCFAMCVFVVLSSLVCAAEYQDNDWDELKGDVLRVEEITVGGKEIVDGADNGRRTVAKKLVGFTTIVESREFDEGGRLVAKDWSDGETRTKMRRLPSGDLEYRDSQGGASAAVVVAKTDEQGRLVAKKSPRSAQAWVYEGDRLARHIDKIEVLLRSGSIYLNTLITFFRYDDEGRLSKTEKFGHVNHDLSKKRPQTSTTYVYDQIGRVVAMVELTNVGNPAKMKTKTTTYTYNAQGDVAKAMQIPGVGGSTKDVFEYKYDSRGNWTRRERKRFWRARNGSKVNISTTLKTREITYRD